MLVLLKRNFTTKFGFLRIEKGQICKYDTETSSIIIQYGRMQVYVRANLGKDVQELDWLEIKRLNTKIKQTPGKGLTFEKKKRTNANTKHKRPIA